MLASFKILSSVSGKAIILSISNRKYVFNVFEGFQRLLLENGISLTYINTFFLPNKLSVSPFLAAYLTIGNNPILRKIDVVSNKLLKLDQIFDFIQEQNIELNMIEDFEDKFIKVKVFYVNGIGNYIIDFTEFRNTFLVQNVPSVIPKSLYKQLSNGEVIIYNGIEYDGKKYCKPKIKLERMCIFFSYKFDILSIDKDVKVFFCMNRACFEALKRLNMKDIKIYYIENSNYVDYTSFYEMQIELNKTNEDYLLPVRNDLNIPDFIELINGKTDKNFSGQSTNFFNNEDCIENNRQNHYISEKYEKNVIKNIIEEPNEIKLGKFTENSIIKSDQTVIENFTEDIINKRTINSVEAFNKDIIELKTKNKDENYANNFNEVIFIKNGDVLEFSKENFYYLKKSSLKDQINMKNEKLTNTITFLGTSCAIPTKYRNVSGIIYESEKSAVLLDCGEDTAGQILRIFGNLDVLYKLKAIYLSHSHADHILGVPTILSLTRQNVKIIGPASCKKFINDIIEKNIEYIVTDQSKKLEKKFYNDFNEINIENLSENNEFWKKYVLSINIDEFMFRVCGCKHSFDSTSLSLYDSCNDRKISYSGDSLPSILFSFCAYKSDLLIHESTFKPEQKDQASVTNHSTENDAKRIFEISHSKKLLLTHVSNRNHDIFSDSYYVSDFYRYKLL